ncbi:ubiquitin conjugation factor E4 A [Harpegnathos saltator]|uniref:Ubiquitin conjugation factor E4 A n=1 Tax=Harpegnathos saltator TaxID=610380 RepID=E2BI54_HARSA|nr:ubiquitin conjugation factor E4 A [Harpegnathos saltator]EFN84625.1 Ubiquitin conjugation factor E4 A [Harpegnathos saltator]
MCDNVKGNPFAGLFSSVNEAISFSSQHQANDDESSNANYVEQSSDVIKDEPYNVMESRILDVKDKIDQLMADVFGLALHSDSNNVVQKALIFIDTDSIEHAVFERLMLPNPAAKMTYNQYNCKAPSDSHIVQAQVIPYLYESYCRLKQYNAKSGLEDIIRDACQIVLRNANTALQEPDLFQSQEVHNQFVALFMDDAVAKTELFSFVSGIIEELIAANEGSNIDDIVSVSFKPILYIIHRDADDCNLFTFRHQWFALLHMFSTIELLAKLIIHCSIPKTERGSSYEVMFLGVFFRISCLPIAKRAYGFFDKPLQQSNIAMEGSIWTAMDTLSEHLHKIFHSLLKCSTETRHLTLQWLGDCLHANRNRGRLWNSHIDMGLAPLLCVSDGFMLNVGNVLLRLCQPFCVKSNDDKIPKIDPTYCSAEAKDEADALQRGIHMKGLSSETCLIPIPEGESRPTADSFGFITECFFLTHRALDLGYRVILDKFLRTNQDLARIQRTYNDARTGGSSEVLDLITQRMESEMTKYLALKASLLVPEMLQHLARFHAMTAFWLIQVNIHDVNDEEDKQNFAPKQCKSVTFPLSEAVPTTLRCIPEFVVENTIEFLCLLRRLNPNTFEEQGPSFLNPILTELIVLMESQHRLYNPHLRARLAEGLEALLPIIATETLEAATPNLGTFRRKQLFVTHPHRQQIIAHLLHVFVSIEMTGQSVQFEQKFNYRRPMYIVMDYLWRVPEHRNNFIVLAQEAEDNMEAVQPPLFLRFINLLMNDAVFLLDEALSNMAQLRQMLQARESGEWNKLPPNERDQQAGYLQHIGMIARFDNILGKKTIQAIKMLTSEIKSIFCHPTMVDRIASMLNYLLLQLVGPNKKNLKVNDQKEYAFNPANLVLNICEIYINLSKNESFTLAVSQDGRSYSPELFKLADNVLIRIGGVGILGDLNQFAKSVEKAANQKREEDEILTGVPDEFLDPIMSTVMTDPVILPSSRITINRQTIARHLLSDQTDPFNRSPLTMDMVKPDIELQQKIQKWISQKKQEKSQGTNS